MKSVLGFLPAAALLLGLALAGLPATAQQAAQQALRPPKPASPPAIAAAKEILQMKNATAMYAGRRARHRRADQGHADPQANLNYQKDLNEVAPIVAQKLDRQGEARSATAWRRSMPTSSPSRN